MAKASKKIKALFFRTASGKEPVRDWLKGEVDDEDRSIIGADIATVEYGWPVGMPTSRPLGAGLHEVRSSLPGNRSARVIFPARVYQEDAEDLEARPRACPEPKEGAGIMSARKAKSGRAGTGSAFAAFLKEEGLYERAQALAIKRVIAWQIAQEMEKQSLSKVAMAGLMQTSRSQLDRLLDPDNDQVKLETLSRAAKALGRKLKVALA